MLKKDLIEKNPIRHLKGEGPFGLGLVMSRAGLGKTAILVQIALDSLLNGKQVVHISVGQTLEKTRLWYYDIFKDIAEECKLENAAAIYDEIVRNRMIMTFNASSITRPKLEERLGDLMHQNIIRPNCIVVDGFDFTNTDRQIIADLRAMAESMELQVWFSAVSRSEDKQADPKNVPAPCQGIEDLFDTIVILQPAPEKGCIDLNIVKDTGGLDECNVVLKLDPITLLINERCKDR